MSYSAASVANAFLFREFRDKVPISPMKIQKLLYIAHGYNLYLYHEPLIDETFEAWKFGPVLSSIYHACKQFSIEGISAYVTELDLDLELEIPVSPPPESDKNTKKIIDFVWDHYGTYAAMRLSKWTHEQGGPWDKTTKGGRNWGKAEIPNELIEEYFHDNLSNRTEAEAS